MYMPKLKRMAGTSSSVHFHDMPDGILTTIFSLVPEIRTRNAMSLVCLKWLSLERSTRKSLTLRGNIHDLFLLPTCFRAITDLDLSSLSPWGYPLLDSFPNPLLLAQYLKHAFPSVVSLVVYIRNPSTLHLLAPQWPNLQHVKLIRWHQRFPTTPIGYDFVSLFEHCSTLSSLDVSHFHCWPEDIPHAIQAYPSIAASLSHLNILKHSSNEGFKSCELLAITASCPNLRKLLATCVFDPRFIGFVDDQTLLALASNCPHLSLLHLVDTTSMSNVRYDQSNLRPNDASISHATLGDVFSRLPLLEELVLDIGHKVMETGPALELLNSKCPKLKSLKLGQFLGICRGPDGVALCKRLESLSIKNSTDLTDNSLISISHGCTKLTKFELLGCNRITAKGIWEFTHNLSKTLVDVKISCCKNLKAVSPLQALEPIRDSIQKLHIDCVWESTLSQSQEKSLKKTWIKLQYLSLWIAVGELLTPLSFSGLQDCPVLEEIQIKIEGDCRDIVQLPKRRPLMGVFGLGCLTCYPSLIRMNLDCSGVTGYALTAPIGQADLSLWERFFLSGIEDLKLVEIDYWTAQDVDVNQRSVYLPGAGLLWQCGSLRKLFIHGTVNEHMMMFLLRNRNLRDVQVREDYYPAPENDTSSEMRVESCRRFEDALNSSSRQVPD